MEAEKAESARILEMIKTDDIEVAKSNLEFLMETGLISNGDLTGRIQDYLETHPSPVLPALGDRSANCDDLNLNLATSTPLAKVSIPPTKKCTIRFSNNLPIPDPECTPGAIHKDITASILGGQKFRSWCLRDSATKPVDKAATYAWYGITPPKNNSGQNMVCELDHLIPLGLGGGDTLDNVWPQCGGPPNAPSKDLYFKQKDIVENYLVKQVKLGKIPLDDAQRGIARDWTQYLEAAKGCAAQGC